MNWMLVAIVCVVALSAPRHPDHFTMRVLQEEFDSPRERAECVADQVAKQLNAEMCSGVTKM